MSMIADGQKVNVCIKIKARLAEALLDFKEIVQMIQDEVKADQNLEIAFRLGATPKSILQEGGEPILMQLLKGISIDINLNLWKKLSDLIMRIVGNCEVDASIIPILAGVSPLFLLQLGGSLDITVDEEMQNKIKEHPMVEPALMDAETLITSLSGKSYENED